MLKSVYTFIASSLGWHVSNIRDNKLHRKPNIAEQAQLTEGSHTYYVKVAFWCLVLSAVALYIWPDLLPFGVLDLWHTHGTIGDWLLAGIPAFIWGGGITFIASILTRNKPEENRDAEVSYRRNFVLAIWAGVAEEMSFRWARFVFGAIIVQPVNWLLLGFAGYGIPMLLQTWILGPVANFFTLGHLSFVLTNPSLWFVGAGVISANSAFRDGHKYLGLFGYINSWFIGMFFFYLMFTYGLPAAILVHFLYDALIFTIRYLDEVQERARGNA